MKNIYYDMLSSELIASRVEFKKSRSLESVGSQPIVSKTISNFHWSPKNLSRVTACYDKNKIKQHKDTAFNDKINFENQNIKKGEEIELVIKNSTQIEQKEVDANVTLELTGQQSHTISQKAFRKALEHDCFYDIIKEDGENLTVAFLPLSTSNEKVFCGLEQFNKVHLLTNGLKNFYITRILFHKIMTKEKFAEWELKSKMWYQDIKFRKKLFNEIQKDLDKNSYSLLKEEDLLNFNLQFFINDLPKVKFTFSELVV